MNIDKWQGEIFDTGAQYTVIGISKAQAYCLHMGVKFKTSKNKKKYKFCNDRQKSLGAMNIRIPIPGYKVINLKVDVVSANVPFIIGLDFLDKYRMFVNTVTHTRCARILDLQGTVVRKRGHIYLERSQKHKILFTKSELVKINRNFSHPSTDKLYNLLKVARPWETDNMTKTILEEISRLCSACQRFSPGPIRFKASIPMKMS